MNPWEEKFYDERSELRAQVSALKQELQSRDEFLSLVAHELKTPIAAIKLKFQMGLVVLKEDPESISPAGFLKLFQDGDHQLTRLVRFLDNLLDFSHLQGGTLHLHLAETNLTELILEVCERYTKHFSHAKSTLKLELDPSINGVWDRDHLDQVLTNLLTNALRYAPHSLITIRTASSGSLVHLSVTDTGPGISPAQQEKLFDLHQQGSFQDQSHGIRLGLYVSREIVNAHHGRIWVESRIGDGTTLHVSLPLDSRAPQSH